MKKILLLVLLTVTGFITYGNSVVSQKDWRWRKDDGTETAATWHGAQNQAITVSTDEKLRLRVQFLIASPSNCASTTSAHNLNINYQLSYSTDPNGTYIKISTDATGKAFILSGSTSVSGNAVTTAQITGAAETFTDGAVIDETRSSDITFTTPNCQSRISEYEWVIKPTSSVRPTTYYFKLEDLNSYSVTLPSITYNTADLMATQTSVCKGIATSVSVTPSQTDAIYQLRDNDDNSVIGGPQTGTGTALSFNTAVLNNTKTYHVYGVEKSSYLNFEGDGDVLVSNGTGIPTGSESFTVEAWFKPDAFNGGIIGWGNYGTDHEANALRFNGSSTELYHYFWFNDLAVTVPDMNDGNWHHVAVTFDGTTRTIYFDGVNVGSDTPVNVNVGPATNLTIGKTYSTEYYYGGISDVRIWNIARSGSDINTSKDATLAGTETGLVAYYTFEDGTTSTTVRDLAGGNNNGTLENMSEDQSWMPNAGFQIAGTVTVTVKTVNVNVDESANILTAEATGGATYQWVDCYNVFAPIDGETNQTFTAIPSGGYAVIVTENNCADTSDCFDIISTGLNSKNTGNRISIYPTPAESNLSFEINSGSNENAEVILLNALGTQVHSEIVTLTSGTNTKQLNVEKFARGTYFLQVIQNDRVTTEKVILK